MFDLASPLTPPPAKAWEIDHDLKQSVRNWEAPLQKPLRLRTSEITVKESESTTCDPTWATSLKIRALLNLDILIFFEGGEFDFDNTATTTAAALPKKKKKNNNNNNHKHRNINFEKNQPVNKHKKTRERPPEGVVCFTGKLCRNAAHAKRSQVFFSQVAKKKNIHTEELSSVCNHQRTKTPPVTMCIIHRKNINFGCNLLQHTSVPKNILSVCNQQRTKISPPHTPPKTPPCHNVHHPPKNTNFGFNLLQHTSVPKNILSVCNQQRTKISPPPPPPVTMCIIHRRTSTLVVICYNTHLYRRKSSLFAIHNERKYPPPTPPTPCQDNQQNIIISHQHHLSWQPTTNVSKKKQIRHFSKNDKKCRN